MKLKEFGPPGGGRVPGAPPLDPPMITESRGWIGNCNVKVWKSAEHKLNFSETSAHQYSMRVLKAAVLITSNHRQTGVNRVWVLTCEGT